MLTREVKLLNTDGKKINVRSAVSCSSRGRGDLTAVASGEKFYVVNNYFNIDNNAYFVGDYIKINKDLFYLMAYSYSYDVKKELFGPNMFFYEDMISEILSLLKPNESKIARRKNNHSNLQIDTIRCEIQSRLLGIDPSINTRYLVMSLKKIHDLDIEDKKKYLSLLSSMKNKDLEMIEEYAELLRFRLN